MQTKTISCAGKQAVTVTLKQLAAVTISSEPASAEKQVTIPSPAPSYLRLISGPVSVSGDTVTLRSRTTAATVLRFAPPCTVELRYAGASDANGIHTELPDITCLRVTDCSITYEAGTAQPKPDKKIPSYQNPPVPPSQQATADTLTAENTQLKLQLAASRKEADALRSQNQGLQEAAKARLEDYAAVVSRSAQLPAPLQERAKAILAEKAKKEAEKAGFEQDLAAQEQINAALEQENAQLKQQLENAQGQEEFLRLVQAEDRQELDSMTRQLQALAQRLQLDEDVTALTQSRFLKGESISKNLEKAAHTLTATEELIGLVLRARELYEKSVQSAIYGGDGLISTDQECGQDAPAAEG